MATAKSVLSRMREMCLSLPGTVEADLRELRREGRRVPPRLTARAGACPRAGRDRSPVPAVRAAEALRLDGGGQRRAVGRSARARSGKPSAERAARAAEEGERCGPQEASK